MSQYMQDQIKHAQERADQSAQLVGRARETLKILQQSTLVTQGIIDAQLDRIGIMQGTADQDQEWVELLKLG